VKVNVAGVECNALNNSGCQIPVVSTCLFYWCDENAIGSVVLSGFSAGQRMEALLVIMDVCMSGDADMCNIVTKMPLVCAIADLGSVVLSGFSAGQRTEALLVSLDVWLSGDADMCNIVEKMPLVCAIADLDSQDYDVGSVQVREQRRYWLAWMCACLVMLTCAISWKKCLLFVLLLIWAVSC